MDLGAVVVAPGVSSSVGLSADLGIWGSTWPVLGRTILDRWVERVHGMGVGLVSVVDQQNLAANRIHTIVDWAKQGVEQILLIMMGAYAEVDLTDLVRFHHQGRHPITRVFDPEGPLGITLLERRTILESTGLPKDADRRTATSRYDFLGYVIRLSSTLAYRKLVHDALEGRCGIEPYGVQVRDRVWIHPSAKVDPSAQLHAPSYVGRGCRLNAGVVLRGASSVECNCEIDIGTILDHSSVLPNTYLASGLHLRSCVVDGTRLEHLDRGVTVDLNSTALSSSREPARPQLSATSGTLGDFRLPETHGETFRPRLQEDFLIGSEGENA